MSSDTPVQSALVVVDFQEDFCPPHGSLAVEGGRDIAGVINELLDLPFAIKVATQDWHPRDHISFASNHPGPDNKPFESTIDIQNPTNLSESVTSRLWPEHCIQGTKGAELVPELDASKLDHVVRKGQDKRIEMYSAFRDPFRGPSVCESNLASLLREASIGTVYVVGLAADYCVKQTALHAKEEGFTTIFLQDATRAVDNSDEALKTLCEELEAKDILLQSSSDCKTQLGRSHASGQ